MDYCSTCRRHLNGALVCPGCGAYAPDIAPGLADGHTIPGRATATPAVGTAAWEFPASDASGAPDASYATRPETKAGADTGAAPAAPAPQDEPYGGPEGAIPVPQGRAARRRQLARWKKNQRRAVVATAVALVGGGLTVASLDRPSGDRAQAATAPDPKGMGSVEEPAEQYTRPTPTRPATQPVSRTRPERAPEATTPLRLSTAAPTPAATPPSPRPDAADAPHKAVTSPQQPRTTPPAPAPTAPDRGDTAPQQTPPPPAANDSTDSGAAQSSPAPAATQPEQLCLLVVCLG
ncbi:hypothetical protein GCM10027074_34770 [Streptomyces deserti]